MAKLLIVAFIATLVSAALSCSCLPSTFNQSYCQSDVVARAKVIAQTDNCPGKCNSFQDQFGGQIMYIAKVQATFRGREPEDEIMILKTSVNGALCGVRLNVGASYLFMVGSGTGTGCPGITYSIFLCNAPILWRKLPRENRRFVLENARLGQRLCRDDNDSVANSET